MQRLELGDEPTVEGTTLTIRWHATYTKQGQSPVALSGTERATFEGSAISRFEEILDDGVLEIIEKWMAEFAPGSNMDHPQPT